MAKRNLILLSSGQTQKHGSYYHYCQDFLNDIFSKYLTQDSKILYIPWAIWGGQDEDTVFYWGQRHFEKFGLKLNALHQQSDYFTAIQQADAIITEGGSIHMLVRSLELNQIMLPLKDKLESGCLYLGTSSGSIITGPTMHTATEPPIIHIPSHKTLGVLPFQISPHYYDPDPEKFHDGPSPEDRIKNYLQLNPEPKPVLCLKEGSIVRVIDDSLTTHGTVETVLFDRKLQKYHFQPGSDLSKLLNYRSKYYKTH